jgi:hypothetical protein
LIKKPGKFLINVSVKKIIDLKIEKIECRKRDSNPCRPMPEDLESTPFDHSGIPA